MNIHHPAPRPAPPRHAASRGAACRPAQARPARARRVPRDARRRDRRRGHHRDGGRSTRARWPSASRIWLWLTVLFGTLAEAVAEGRGKAQAASLRALQQETTRAPRARLGRPAEVHRQPHDAPGRPGPEHVAPRRRRRRRRGRRADPRRRRRHRGRRLRRRVGGDRRVRTGHPRVRRRPVRGHRRHRRPLGPDRRPDHLRARPVVRGPDDRPGRGLRAAAHAERDRTEHPAELPHRDLRRGGRHALLLRRLQRHRPVVGRAHRAARLPDPHHHRGAALGDRHRRDGPAGPPQRAGHVRPRGRGSRRRRRAAPRQDRHHHARQPAGHRAAPAVRCHARRARRGGPALVACGRDARGPQHRHAGRRGTRRPRQRPARRVHSDHPDERHRPARPGDPQGCRLGGDALGAQHRSPGREDLRRTAVGAGRRGERLGRHAARRRGADRRPSRPASSASSTSRTSSRTGCALASTRCGRWASAR